jgi:radical SAM protein with 4Fe4S-binding SPASM domain
MDHGLFRRLVEETARHGARRVSPYLMNEPFVDPEIFDRISTINEIHPRARVRLTSNGGLLTRTKVDRLLDLGEGGVHELYLSVQGVDGAAYEATMRGSMRFDRTMGHVEYLLSAMRQRKMKRPAVWITMVDTEIVDAVAAVAFWRRRGVRALATRLENRGGNLGDVGALGRGRRMRPYRDCSRLYRQAYVLFDGDVVLCCTDWRRTVVLGNVRDGGLHAVWNSPRAVKIRQDYQNGRLGENPLCAACTIDPMGSLGNAPRGSAALPRAAAAS